MSSKMKPVMTVDKDGTKIWKLNGELHREDGPAVELMDGTKHWYINGKLHREDGPAVEDSSGVKFWYMNDKHHREDGPACEYPDGSIFWYTNNEFITERVDKDIKDGILKPYSEWTEFDRIKFKLKYL